MERFVNEESNFELETEQENELIPIDQQEGIDEEISIEAKFAAAQEVVTWSTDWTTSTVVTQIKKGVINLNPKFQRRQAWNISKRSDLILSLLTGIPIPQIILAELPNQKGKYIVIDGKQRLLSLTQFLEPDGNFQGFKLRIKDKNLGGKSFEKLDPSLQSIIENSSIRSVIIKNSNADFLYSVFLKLNMGSEKLSPQELRQALVPGPFTDYVDNFAAESERDRRNSIQLLMNLKEPDSRMRDTELAIRYFAFRNNISEYKGNLKEFLDEFSRIANNDWDNYYKVLAEQSRDFERTTNFLIDAFGVNNACRRWNGNFYEKRLNRAVFDALFFNLCNENIIDKLRHHKPDFIKNFKALCINDISFKDAIESSTKDKNRTFYRISAIGDLINDIIGEEIAPKIKM